MARVLPRSPSSPPRSAPLAWRATKAMGGAVVGPVLRLIRRLVLLAVILAVLGTLVWSVVTRVRTPGAPTRLVSPGAGISLTQLRQAGQRQLTLTEGDLTAAFRQATKLPTVPLTDGQVVVLPDALELFGRVKASRLTAAVLAVPSVANGNLVVTVRSLTVGRQAVPRWLAGVLAGGGIEQLVVAMNAAVPDLAAVALADGRATLRFR